MGLTLPVPIVHNAPAPILNHFVQPVPVAPTPIAPVPAFIPDARNFFPVNQVFQPNQFSFVPAPQPEALPLSQIPAPLNLFLSLLPQFRFLLLRYLLLLLWHLPQPLFLLYLLLYLLLSHPPLPASSMLRMSLASLALAMRTSTLPRLRQRMLLA